MADIYTKPWCRVGPYAVGLILGYILHVTRGKYTMTKVGAHGHYDEDDDDSVHSLGTLCLVTNCA